MKRKVFLAFLLLALLACNPTGIEKPDNLIEEEKMVDILHDLYLIEGIRQANPASFQERKLVSSSYIYHKYHIDSLQFVQSDRWYAADMEQYKKMYDRVLERLDEEGRQNGAAVVKPKVKKPKLPSAARTRADFLQGKK